MLKRITIVCSENDKKNIEDIFGYHCPFDGDIETCNEDSTCECCIDENVKFIVIDNQS